MDDSVRTGKEIIDYLDFSNQVEAMVQARTQALEMLAAGPGEFILDAACGTGEDSRAIARRVGNRGRVVGVDANETVLNEARKRDSGAGPLHFVRGMLEALPFDDSYFDGLIANRILHLLPQAHTAFGELVRVLKPGGRIVLSEPDWGMLVVDSPYADIGQRVLSAASPPWENGVEGRNLYSLMKGVGLKQVTVIPVTGVFTRLDQAWRLLGLEDNAVFALRNGRVHKEELQQWVDRILDYEAEDKFFASLTGFIARGVK